MEVVTKAKAANCFRSVTSNFSIRISWSRTALQLR